MRFRHLLAGLGLAASVAIVTLATIPSVRAADLGGACCADLEERIAELEAATVRKGNHKVAVTLSGQINKTVLYWDIDDTTDWSVGDNSNDPSYLQIGAHAKIGGSWAAGFVMQIGLGGYESRFDPVSGGVGYGHFDGGTNKLYTRQAFAYIEGDMGKISLGKQSQATDGIMDANTSKASIVSTALSWRPLTGPSAGEALDIFDGGRTDAVRYDTPLFAGFMISASIAPVSADVAGGTDGSIWDVALRYQKEVAEFKILAGIGYRHGVVIENDDLAGLVTIGSNVGDVEVYSGSASVMHIPTGLFVTGAAGEADLSDWGGPSSLKGWHVQGGVEERWGKLGKTTVFVEHGQWDFGSGVEPMYWGAGVVQAIDAAALDIYVSGRKYDMDNLFGISDVTVLTAGARVRF